MRKLTFATNLSLDGCCDHSKLGGDEQVLEYFTHLMREVDLHIYGRTTYQLMVPYWPEVAKDPAMPKAATAFARAFEAIPRVVFSRTLESADENTRIVGGGLRDEVLQLKQAPGKNMMTGGVSLPAQLVELGLVDEYRILLHPAVVGVQERLTFLLFPLYLVYNTF